MTFTVNASDASGVASVTLYYWGPYSVSWAPKAMSWSGGTTWTTTLTYPNTGSGSWAGYNFYVYVLATDVFGNSSSLPPGSYYTITIAPYCIG
ncbi:MAG TPA: hypothetical protein VEX41_11085 [Candidatus Eisenbacteria bacterium]|nr:hypothetical protein [Candidatus Eisenbacteria bacterium]